MYLSGTISCSLILIKFHSSNMAADSIHLFSFADGNKVGELSHRQLPSICAGISSISVDELAVADQDNCRLLLFKLYRSRKQYVVM